MARLASITAVLVGCGFHFVSGSGVSADETREVASFRAVTLDTAMDATISVGGEQDVHLECDDNLLELIELAVEDQTLFIRVDDDLTIRPATTCLATITVPELVEVTSRASGSAEVTSPAVGVERFSSEASGDVTAGGVVTDSIVATASASGAVGLVGVEVTTVTATASGSGAVTLGGTAQSASLTTNASGDLRARELIAQDVVAVSDGSGGIQTTAETSIDATTNGSGNIEVWGDPPDTTVQENGSGQVLFR